VLAGVWLMAAETKMMLVIIAALRVHAAGGKLCFTTEIKIII